MRLGLQGQVRRVWASRGVEVVQPQQFVFEWCYLLLGVNPRTGAIQWDWIDSMKVVDLKPALEQWDVDGIIWDRAPSHRAQDIEALDFEAIYQPAYSPELNPVERLFEELRRAVEGRIYDTLEDKQQAVEAVLQQWETQPDLVQSIAGWDWLCKALDELPSAA